MLVIRVYCVRSPFSKFQIGLHTYAQNLAFLLMESVSIAVCVRYKVAIQLSSLLVIYSNKMRLNTLSCKQTFYVYSKTSSKANET